MIPAIWVPASTASNEPLAHAVAVDLIRYPETFPSLGPPADPCRYPTKATVRYQYLHEENTHRSMVRVRKGKISRPLTSTMTWKAAEPSLVLEAASLDNSVKNVLFMPSGKHQTK
jgi:hypothetical protein